MPYPNEHSARVRDPGDFRDDTIRSKEIEAGIRIIIGKLKPDGDSMETQAYRFKSDKFTPKEAKTWLKEHDVKYISFESATNAQDMATAVLKLYGDIGEPIPFMPEGEGSISAKLVSDFLEQHADAKDLTVRINSRGGDVQEGWAIHDLLVSSGKRIKTIGEGKIYSIATIVFLAGEEREIMKNADGLIHNPFIPPYTLADQYESEDLLKIAEELKQEEDKILDFYAERNGTPKEKLAEYMKEDTKLSAEDMLTLGFATKIIEPVRAYAYIKPKNNFVMDKNEVKTFGEKLDTIIAAVGKITGLSRLPANMVLTDKDGKEIKVEKETGSPAVGDAASPDGSFSMADGKTITIANGKITQIKEPDNELDAAKQRIAQLETEVANLKKAAPDAAAAKAAYEQKTVEIQALVTELSNLKNTWKPEGRTRFSSVDRIGDVNLTRAKEIAKNLKNNEPVKPA